MGFPGRPCSSGQEEDAWLTSCHPPAPGILIPRQALARCVAVDPPEAGGAELILGVKMPRPCNQLTRPMCGSDGRCPVVPATREAAAPQHGFAALLKDTLVLVSLQGPGRNGGADKPDPPFQVSPRTQDFAKPRGTWAACRRCSPEGHGPHHGRTNGAETDEER